MRDAAFLLFEAHPYGRRILEKLITAGHIPLLVIEERSIVGRRRRLAYEALLQGHKPPAYVGEICEAASIPRITVDDHNGDSCVSELARIRPRFIFLGNTRILLRKVFKAAADGCFNVHPGRLPEARGSGPIVWSIIRDEPIECTLHLVDDGIDSGPVVARSRVEVFRGMSLGAVYHSAIEVCADLMVSLCNDVSSGRGYALKPQPELGFTDARWPSETKFQEAAAKLANGSYKCFHPYTTEIDNE